MYEYNMTYPNELYHYGVLGMKWGKRKADRYAYEAKISRASADEWDEMARNATAKGKMKKAAKYKQAADGDRAYAAKLDSKSKYTYKSHSTKKYDRKAATASESAKEWEAMAAQARKKGKIDKANKYDAAAKADRADAAKYSNRAKRSKELDRKEQQIAENQSTGKTVVTRLFTLGLGAKNYQQFQAMGDSKTKAAAKAAIDVALLGCGSRLAKAKYLRQDEQP